MDFIHPHLLKVIKELIIEKKKELGNYDGFLHLNEPLLIDNYSEFCYEKKVYIDRIYFRPYAVSDAVPMSWYLVRGFDLLRILKLLKENEFYVYKNEDGEKHIVRL